MWRLRGLRWQNYGDQLDWTYLGQAVAGLGEGRSGEEEGGRQRHRHRGGEGVGRSQVQAGRHHWSADGRSVLAGAAVARSLTHELDDAGEISLELLHLGLEDPAGLTQGGHALLLPPFSTLSETWRAATQRLVLWWDPPYTHF